MPLWVLDLEAPFENLYRYIDKHLLQSNCVEDSIFSLIVSFTNWMILSSLGLLSNDGNQETNKWIVVKKFLCYLGIELYSEGNQLRTL
jgi:hypothetical protein